MRHGNLKTSPESLTTNPFHIVHKLQEARRKVCSTTWNSYSTTWNGCFSTWNSYFTSWNAEVYYILLVLFLLSCVLASKLRFIEFTLFNVSSTNSTLCAQPCYCRTVETHSCVSASCQVFATGDFIRQSCLPRRKNASLQVFVELTLFSFHTQSFPKTQ